jgi:light-regulated signal transduction histidine kinase (bacteriophytochrome)
VVDGRLWGAMVACKAAETLPPDTEERVAQFAELVSTAISNVESRTKVERLATEQAALRRVATLVAEGGDPTACSTQCETKSSRCSESRTRS